MATTTEEIIEILGDHGTESPMYDRMQAMLDLELAVNPGHLVMLRERILDEFRNLFPGADELTPEQSSKLASRLTGVFMVGFMAGREHNQRGYGAPR